MGGSSRGCRVPRRGGHLDQLPAVYTWPAYSNALYYNFDLSHFHSKYFSSSIQDFPLCKYFLIWYVHKCLVLSSYSNALCFNFDWMHIPIAFIIFQCKSQNRKMPHIKIRDCQGDEIDLYSTLVSNRMTMNSNKRCMPQKWTRGGGGWGMEKRFDMIQECGHNDTGWFF